MRKAGESARLVTRLASGTIYRTICTRGYASAASAPLAHPNAGAPIVSPSKGYGQPLPSTHSHLLAPGELTPGISAEEYEHRRRALMEGLEEGSIVLIAGGRLKFMTGAIFYKFRQATNFWYLTGWEEPDSFLVLGDDAKGYKMTLFSPQKNPYDEMWHGARSGREGAMEVFGADDAVDIAHLAFRLKSLLHSSSNTFSSPPLYIDIPGVTPSSRTRLRPSTKTKSILEFLVPTNSTSSDTDEVMEIVTGQKGNRPIKSAAIEVEKLRLIKSPAELRVMRRAADISSAAHSKASHLPLPPTETSSKLEHSLVSHFEYQTALAGSLRPAYVPVCASGASGLTVHYTKNLLPLYSGDLVVLDAGCEWGGYASDITRTFPVSGSFSGPQKDLYEAALRVQKACIKLCSADQGMSLDDLHARSSALLRSELIDLGFTLRGNDLERTVYPHFVGHPIGIDLHDTFSFGRNERIKSGMVITIEPGIFVPPHPNFPKEFHNLSARVEDEVLVREDDYVVLSVNAPKEVVDVEACCQGLLEWK
ncbi:Creatinase/aminopeptidase [Meredithblackwellia eburnea MCA 4105]